MKSRSRKMPPWRRRICLAAAGAILCLIAVNAQVQAGEREVQTSYGDLLDINEQSYENTVYSGPIDLTGADYLTFRRVYVTGGKCCDLNGAYAGGVIRISVVDEATGGVLRSDEKWYAGHGDEEVRIETADLSGSCRISAYVTVNTGECEKCGTRKTVNVKISGLTGHSTHSVPAVLSGPLAQETEEGGSASFAVQAAYTDAYRWQKFAGGTWSDLSDATPAQGTSVNGAGTATLLLQNVAYGENQTAYRCVCQNSYGEQAVSGEAPLTVRDIRPPVFGTVRSPEGWTNDKVKISVANAADTGSGLTAEAFSFDGGNTWTAQTFLETDKNGSYKVCARDNAGNVSAVDTAVTNIDKTLPVITGLRISPEGWTNLPVEITAGAQDKESGLAAEAYSFDGGKTYGSLDTFKIGKNGTVVFCVRDKAGNISSRSIAVDKIDVLDPKITLTKEPAAWTAGDVVIHAAATDAPEGAVSGLPEKPYSFDGGRSFCENPDFKISENGTYQVLVRDSAGNTVKQSIEIANIDKKEPEIIKYLADNAQWTSRDVKLSIEARDKQSGLAAQAYSFDGGRTWSDKPEYLSKKNGNCELRVRDAVGNVAKARITVQNIDKKPPSGQLAADIKEWTKNSVTVSLSAEDEEEGSGLAGEFACYDQGKTWEKRTEFSVAHNGQYDVWIRDNAGNIGKCQIAIGNIDKEPPVIDSIKPSATGWTGEDVRVIVKAEDGGSGLAKEAFSFDGGVRFGAEGEVVTGENGRITVTVRDKAGNTAEGFLDVANIDKTPPKITAFWQEPDGWTNRDVDLHVEALDAQSGLAKEPYSFDGGESWTDARSFAVSKNGGYSVLVKDICGNVGEARIQVGRIDRTPPQVVLKETERNPDKKTVKLKAVVTDLESGPLAQGYSWDNGKTFGASDTIEVMKSGIYKVIVSDAAYNRASATAAVMLDQGILSWVKEPVRYKEIPKKKTQTAKKNGTDEKEGLEEPEQDVVLEQEEPVLADRKIRLEKTAGPPEKTISGFQWRRFLLLAMMAFLLLIPLLIFLILLWIHMSSIYGIKEDGSCLWQGFVFLHPDHGQYRTRVKEAALQKTGTGKGKLRLKKAFVFFYSDRELLVQIAGEECWHKIEREIFLQAHSERKTGKAGKSMA